MEVYVLMRQTWICALLLQLQEELDHRIGLLLDLKLEQWKNILNIGKQKSNKRPMVVTMIKEEKKGRPKKG
jgi:hypothetical protein